MQDGIRQPYVKNALGLLFRFCGSMGKRSCNDGKLSPSRRTGRFDDDFTPMQSFADQSIFIETFNTVMALPVRRIG
jgi:hypothetical protein